MKLSERVTNLKTSPTLQVKMDATRLRAEGVDILDFGPGEPDFDTPVAIRQAAKDALDRDKSFSLIADLSMGVGVVALGVGAYLLLKPGDDDAEESSEASVGILPGGAEVQWSVRF